ncbi:STAS domain-containing protein [Aliiruegeria sabulilitoris]|uniref:STAS domain-containing protein n=1 Tax=Aliiruegeria sabulilitoris TaxID=1510458 RepID=UPI000A8D0DCF|nr:STAS domain-containing protein [Aliiruegeria sabulilitoris]NDR58105.1 STAS domain-containing protein [Pseudoruegeria sp. M32A2M]
MSAELALPARLDLPAATPLAEAITALRGQDLRMSAEAVTHLGTPGLQVLLSAARSWAADGKSFSLQPCSEAFTEQLSIFGIDSAALSAPGREV